ncbi:MAG: RNA polymerase factor sigma-54, partial [Candidatus Sedimenticola endophacoides]
MKQTLQLRLGQHLTMTPQLQQAIRLLQLSTLDLKQEIQEALESNPLLETEEEGLAREEHNGAETKTGADKLNGSEGPAGNDANNEQTINVESETMPEELPVDTGWDDIYDSALPPSSGLASRESGDTDYTAHRQAATTLQDHLMWQLNLTPFSDTDRAIATAIVDSINDDGYLHMDVGNLIEQIDDGETGRAEIEAVLH